MLKQLLQSIHEIYRGFFISSFNICRQLGRNYVSCHGASEFGMMEGVMQWFLKV